jgi:hypothetical protein
VLPTVPGFGSGAVSQGAVSYSIFRADLFTRAVGTEKESLVAEM